ncbi:hypothetical protein, partial [Sphingobacterium bovisgrunnientis]|uniref:hypothetical protein n=1 Tax=Sphingobacterium bovisgrunnientis TaxID=1874697 RepID=UPI00135AE565
MKDKIGAPEVQLMSIDTNKDTRVDVLTQFYNTKQEYQQIPRSDPPCGSSSGPKKDIIIQNPRKIRICDNPKKIIINEDHTRSIQVQPDEEDEIP